MVNATIRIKGLGICCFNNSQERAEMAFLRCDGHNLTITVSKNGTPIANFTPDAGKLIEITSESSAINGFEISKDFGLILDLEGENLHNRQLLPKEPQQMSLSRMHIHNARFNAASVASDLYLLKLVNGKPEYLIKKLSKVGEEIEAIAEAKSITLAIEGEESVLLEDSTEDYEIVVDNHCDHPADGSSDFLLYYNVLNDPDGIQFALAKERPEIEPESPPFVCNVGTLGRTSTIDDLFA